MKKYKFIQITQSLCDGDYKIYNLKSRDWIGSIRRYKTWNQWVFTSASGSIWSADCLRDVINFIEIEIPKGVKA